MAANIFRASPYFASFYHTELIIDHHGSAGLLGSVAPCVLYGGNAERLGSAPGNFANHCLTYTGLYLIGQSFFGSNCVAPCFTYPSRTAIRRKFNLEVGYLFFKFHLSEDALLKVILCYDDLTTKSVLLSMVCVSSFQLCCFISSPTFLSIFSIKAKNSTLSRLKKNDLFYFLVRLKKNDIFPFLAIF